MRNADRDNAVRHRRPQKTAALQPLREQTRPLTVMPNDLDQVAAAAPKNVEITSVRIMLQALLNQTRQARESAAHIGMAGRKPHPHIARYGDYRRSSTSRTCASALTSVAAGGFDQQPPERDQNERAVTSNAGGLFVVSSPRG